MASARVLGSRRHDGHARADRSPITGGTGTTTGGRLDGGAPPSGRVVLRWRYKVVRETPSTSATSVKGVPAFTIRAACFVLASVITDGRAPTRPRRRAAASPGMVRSRFRSRSNSAKEPKM